MSEQGMALASLMQLLQLPSEWLSRIQVTGSDPVVPSRYRVGLASATALGAMAVGIGEVWRQRGGGVQDIHVDIKRAAVPGLRTVAYLKREGLGLQLGRPASESQVFFETRDGRQMYLLRHAFYHEHHSRLLASLGCSSSTESIAQAVARHDALELEDALARDKAMGTIARTWHEWLAHPQGAYLSARTPIEVLRVGDSESQILGRAERPLAGLRVVDMGHVLAGPIVSRCLAEQGADVLHVSAPHLPDPNHIVVDTGFGKRTAYADLRSAEGREGLKRVIAEADVFVHSWRTGSLEQYGLSAEELAQLRPGLIYVALSCYGSGGPWATRAGYDPFGQVVSGLAVGEGSLSSPALASTYTLNDYLAGYLAAAGVVSALLRRAQDGGSYRVNVSLTGASMWLQQLGQLHESLWPDGPLGVAALPEVDPLHLTTTQTPYGEIEHARPIVQYSATRAYWAFPPMPEGAMALAWK
jgi:hypothetical protein